MGFAAFSKSCPLVFLFWYLFLWPSPTKKKELRWLAGIDCLHAGGFFCCFSLPLSKEKQPAMPVLQNLDFIVLIFKYKRCFFYLLFCNFSTECPPRPNGKCNCSKSVFRDIWIEAIKKAARKHPDWRNGKRELIPHLAGSKRLFVRLLPDGELGFCFFSKVWKVTYYSYYVTMLEMQNLRKPASSMNSNL